MKPKTCIDWETVEQGIPVRNMEWMIVNPSSIHEICGNLGYRSLNGFYTIKDSCNESIDTLLNQLSHDGPQLRTRRILGFSQTVHKDFVPLLTSATSTSHKVLPKLIKLLSYLSSPIECLIPHEYCLTEEGSQVAFEVDLLLKSIKSEFADFGITQCLVDFIKSITNKSEPLPPEEIDVVSDGLLLLRNILHVPHSEPQLQNQILWNLFAHSVDKIMIHLMTCEQKEVWGITLVQLIALIYKDQHVQNLQKLLNLWLESSMSESSEDNESNTSPKDPNNDGDSDSNLPTSSDPDPDSENGDKLRNTNKPTTSKVSSSSVDFSTNKIVSPTIGNVSSCQSYTNQSHSKSKGKSKCTKGKMSKEKISDADSGIHSMLSHTLTSDTKSSTEDGGSGIDFSKEVECTSTSSNEEDLAQQVTVAPPVLIKRSSKTCNGNHSKPTTKVRIASLKGPPTISPQDKHEMKRKKLYKRSKRNRKSMKALVHHNPTEEDISHILREFTVDFLLKGYSSLVSLLQQQLCGTSSLQMDKSHFLWLITYFLKFASQLELDLEHISVVLSYEMISYLTFEGVAMSENLSLCKDDIKPHLRRMHLVVTAIREFVQAVEIYSNMPSYSHDDKVHLQQLQNDMVNVEELRNLFLLLIRQFRPGVQSKQYLQDLITANHVILLLLEKTGKRKLGEFNVLEFIKEFSSPVIMQQYGYLLEDFRKNGEFVNDCVFTMMHHIAGDLGSPEALCQPLILKTFSNIWEVEFELKDDWADLIEYVIQRFMKVNNDDKQQLGLSNKCGTSNISDDNNSWSKDDIENLHWLYPSCAKHNDPIAAILDAYKESCSGTGKTRESILNQLLQQRIIAYNQFLQLLSMEKISETIVQDNCGDVSSSTGSIDPGNNNLQHLQLPSSMVSISTVLKGPNILEQCRQATFSLMASGMVNSEGSSANLPSSTSTVFQNDQIDLTTSEITVTELINELISEGQNLHWLQKQILEACFVKLCLEAKAQSKGVEAEENETFKKREDGRLSVLEPVPHHYALLGHSIPIIPWTKWQEINMMSPPYMLLFHKLGFHLPADVGKMFPRIPHFWNSEILFSIATKLGPLPLDKLKFDPAKIHDLDSETLIANSHRYINQDATHNEQSTTVLNGCIDEEMGVRDLSLPRSGVGVGVGNCFLQSHGAYGYGSEAHSVSWINLVHKSMQLFDRHSETVDSTSSVAESEHLDDCASLKALPPTDISEDVTMLSAPESDTEDEGQEPDEDPSTQNENKRLPKINDNSDSEREF